MSTISIVFALIILLFGFDPTGQVKTRRQRLSLRRSGGAESFAQEISDPLKYRSPKA
jgi:hypothetical protein